MQKEIWKDIPGYEGYYQASSLGKIRSLDRYVNGKHKDFKYFRKGKNIIGHIASNYYMVLLNKNGKYKNYSIHRLVALTFLKNTENKETVNHKDGNKLNNSLLNLEWATRSENQKHMFDSLGVKGNKYWSGRFGKLNKSYKLVYQYNLCGELLKIFYGAHEAARIINSDASMISKACRNDMYRHREYLWSYSKY